MSLDTSTRVAAGKASVKADSKQETFRAKSTPALKMAATSSAEYFSAMRCATRVGLASQLVFTLHTLRKLPHSERQGSRGGGMVAGALKGKRPRQAEPAGAHECKTSTNRTWPLSPKIGCAAKISQTTFPCKKRANGRTYVSNYVALQQLAKPPLRATNSKDAAQTTAKVLQKIAKVSTNATRLLGPENPKKK